VFECAGCGLETCREVYVKTYRGRVAPRRRKTRSDSGACVCPFNSIMIIVIADNTDSILMDSFWDLLHLQICPFFIGDPSPTLRKGLSPSVASRLDKEALLGLRGLCRLFPASREYQEPPDQF
jgi:hypothetical protein